MAKKIAIKVENVGMRFNLSSEKVDNIKEYFIRFIKRNITYKEFWALKNVSFTINKGDRVAILGYNGAGKSTLLKIVSGVLKPTEGHVKTSGKVVPLLELGAGFDPQYTGVENIYLYGAVLGYTKDFIDSKFDEIIEFSELGDFINIPVKNYSSGMRARLGFSIATIVEPEILILDEVLSVGDVMFRKKSLRHINQMMSEGVTVLFVSHSVAQMRKICNKGLFLDHGEVKFYGDLEDAIELYESDEQYLMSRKNRRRARRKARRLQEELQEGGTNQ